MKLDERVKLKTNGTTGTKKKHERQKEQTGREDRLTICVLVVIS